jgi:pimeloyl-ACP methyl ester carboxylesterase
MLIHAGCCADFFKPLMAEPALADRYRLIRYYRVGYAGSSRLAGPVSIAQQAAHCRSLLRHLGIERAHVAGHSSSAMMALQLALDAPEVVHTLALLDAARPAPQSEVQMEFVKTVVQPASCGLDYRAALEQALPGAFHQVVADTDTFFGQELPAVQQWSFGPEEASHITQPVLVVLGAKSNPIFRERRELLLAWLPNVEPFVLPEATHLLQVQNPRGMAEGLATFFARHPLSASS